MTPKSMKMLLFAAATGLTMQTIAQQTAMVYLDNGLKRIKQELAAYNIALSPTSENTFKGIVREGDGSVKMIGEYMETENGFIEHGTFYFYYRNGELESEGKYDRGVRVGLWKRFTPNGEARTDRYYSPEGAEQLRKVLGIVTG